MTAHETPSKKRRTQKGSDSRSSGNEGLGARTQVRRVSSCDKEAKIQTSCDQRKRRTRFCSKNKLVSPQTKEKGRMKDGGSLSLESGKLAIIRSEVPNPPSPGGVVPALSAYEPMCRTPCAPVESSRFNIYDIRQRARATLSLRIMKRNVSSSFKSYLARYSHTGAASHDRIQKTQLVINPDFFRVKP